MVWTPQPRQGRRGFVAPVESWASPSRSLVLLGLAIGGGRVPVSEAEARSAQADAPSVVLDGLAPADPQAPGRIVTPGESVPNPFVLVDEGRYYMYACQVRFTGPSIPLRVSDRIGHWDAPPIDALPVLPAWPLTARPGRPTCAASVNAM